MFFLSIFLLASCEKSAPEKESESCTPLVQFIDADGDGVGSGASAAVCPGHPGFVATTGDCDDEDPAVYPGALEGCDGLDNNCDGSRDEGLEETFYADRDADGYGDAAQPRTACTAPSGWVKNSIDCDDFAVERNPGEQEGCDGLDNNCDGSIDEGLLQQFYADQDADGYGDPSQSQVACSAPVGWLADAGDCNDADAAIRPDAAEQCDGLDNNCDGSTDGSDARDSLAWYADNDGDGYGAGVATSSCVAPSGYVADSRDCDDQDAAVHPRGLETCNGVDDDCDGDTDDADSYTLGRTSWYEDLDGDGYGGGTPTVSCAVVVGYVAVGRDCDDQDAAVSPRATEICNGLDDDCDGDTDDDDSYTLGKTTWYEDADGDGYGVRPAQWYACIQPVGSSDVYTDCDDGDPARYPTAPEPDCTDPVDYNCDYQTAYVDADRDGWAACSDCDDSSHGTNPDALERCNDGVDNNCDGSIDGPDSANAPTWYVDQDGDGEGDASQPTTACTQPTGYSARGGDCDDSSALLSPRIFDSCDGMDNDCSGVADDNPLAYHTLYPDVDEDSYGDATAPIQACPSQSGYTNRTGDCDDSNGSVHNYASERCNGVDDDCDGVIDDNPSYTFAFLDSDGDGYGDSAVRLATCSLPAGYAWQSGDCDEADSTIHPNLTDPCDGIDQDCDGVVDENPVETWYADTDGDGYVDRTDSLRVCTAPAGYLPRGARYDCDDTNAAIYPWADEYCNGIDDDCNGHVDEGSSVDANVWYEDLDGDGYGGEWQGPSCVAADPAWTLVEGDCDDADAAISPAATETCDGYDSDCDGFSDGCVAPGERITDATAVLGPDQSLLDLAQLPDQTGDGVPELLVACWEEGSEFLLLDGAAAPGGVEAARLATWPSTGLTLWPTRDGVGDFDGDGSADFLLEAEWGDVNPYGLVYLIPGDLPDQADPATGAWATIAGTSSYSLGGGSISTADLDGDGHSELLFNSAYAAILVHEVGAPGAHVSTDAVATMEEAGTDFYGQFGGVDMDGDGYEELWVQSYTTLYRVPGPLAGVLDSGAADRSFGLTGDNWLLSHAVADVDGDGRDDLWISGVYNSYLLTESNTDGELGQVAEARIEHDTTTWATGMVAADFGGDAQVDLALGFPGDDQQAAYGGKVYFYRGPFSGFYLQSDATTSYTGTVPAGSVGATMWGADLNLDGASDLVVGSYAAATGAGGELLFLYGGW